MFKLKVFFPLEAGGHAVHVMVLEINKSLAWVRAHADEIALRRAAGSYNALMVERLPSGPARLPRSFMES